MDVAIPGEISERGFGTAAVMDANVICWCTAEYVSKSKCGIGIEVIDEFQNKGISYSNGCTFSRALYESEYSASLGMR